MQLNLDIHRELLVDNFAGGGGASCGIESALGRRVDIAINHDARAVAMHQANHPETHHYCESVWDIRPAEVTQGRPVGLVWLSPDCKHFSKAKGGKPVEKNIRGLAWVALRWAATVQPRVIMLENVEEFITWGPLVEAADGTMRPCPKRKGQNFCSFCNALRRQGYAVEHRELKACDYGAPTIRKRLFLVARRDGLPIVWPAATHADPKQSQGRGLKAWRTAAECMDFTQPCPSIFERARPLADATLRRVAKGVQQFVIAAEKPFIVGDRRVEIRAQNPVLAADFLARHYTGVVGADLRKPLPTVTSIDHHSLVTSHLIKLRNNCHGQTLQEPLHTITGGAQHFGEVRAFLTKYYGNACGLSLHDPLHTVTSHDRYGLVTVAGDHYQIADIGLRMLSPRELFNAQGFPAGYQIGDDPAQGLSLTKAEQVRMCGNSVSPPVAAALVAANLGEMRIRRTG